LAFDGRLDLLAGEYGFHLRRRLRHERRTGKAHTDKRRDHRDTRTIHGILLRGGIIPPIDYSSPFQSSGSGLTDRKISICHLPPPHGSITSAATTSTRISEKRRPSGSPSRWYAASSHEKFG